LLGTVREMGQELFALPDGNLMLGLSRGRILQILLGLGFAYLTVLCASTIGNDAPEAKFRAWGPQVLTAALGLLAFACLVEFGRPWTTRLAMGIISLLTFAVLVAIIIEGKFGGVVFCLLIALPSGGYALTGQYPADNPIAKLLSTPPKPKKKKKTQEEQFRARIDKRKESYQPDVSGLVPMTSHVGSPVASSPSIPMAAPPTMSSPPPMAAPVASPVANPPSNNPQPSESGTPWPWATQQQSPAATPTKIQCRCGQTLGIPAHLRGQVIQCPKCQHTLQV
jgi:hypothetical protein